VSCYADIGSLAREVYANFPCTPCEWCSEPVAGPRCPFCSMVQRWSETSEQDVDEEADAPDGSRPGARSVA
jgi:hypothetical protein